jgi:DNA-binding NarL/FixJ family response regulator
MSPSKTSSRKSEKKQVLIVDDHPLIRQGIRMLLTTEPDLEVCGEAETASDALAVMEKAKPDVAIVDLTLKESSGLELLKDIRVRYPDVLVLVVSMRDESLYAERVLRAGARGYVTKEEGPEMVLEGLRKILQGQIYVSQKMASKVMSKIVQGADQHGGSPIDHLTDRELAVFELIGKGLPTREIAKNLHISPKTVDSHREHIKDKLKLDSATELLKQGIQWVQDQNRT